MSSFEVQGLKELSKQLSAIGEKTGSKFLRSALTSAAIPVIKSAKANVPIGKKDHKTYKGRSVSPGFAARNLAKRSTLSKDKRTAYVSIGVRREAHYVISYLELGTKHIPKRPWLVKALQKEQFNVVRRFSQQLKRRIEREAKR